ncbi:MAG TPA: isoaspartyl peptidase/L-asparaginase [Pyrinomonadaceae bacterium]|nr:isoaspartyl peptidase/L-asparaginase [Pyrinomonadaceae bacterium]
MSKPALAVHGGAGTILRSRMTNALEAEYRAGLDEGLKAGSSILERGGSALDAVEAAVRSLEDFPLFNAGRGSVFTHEGKIELDASIMDGQRLRAGAVAFARNVKNPVSLARLVMEKTKHILLAADGANQFAQEMGVELADDTYFFTQHRYDQLLEARALDEVQLDHTITEPQLVEEELDANPTLKTGMGTVGAVACDINGHLAAATSTGGMTNKKYGRIGDTPIIGSGTYADETCAVSCTGYGEYFMVGVTAYDLAARMKYRGLSVGDAARETIDRLTSIGGEGGLIAVDAHGNVTLPLNSEGMYRGWWTGAHDYATRIYA